MAGNVKCAVEPYSEEKRLFGKFLRTEPAKSLVLKEFVDRIADTIRNKNDLDASYVDVGKPVTQSNAEKFVSGRRASPGLLGDLDKQIKILQDANDPNGELCDYYLVASKVATQLAEQADKKGKHDEALDYRNKAAAYYDGGERGALDKLRHKVLNLELDTLKKLQNMGATEITVGIIVVGFEVKVTFEIDKLIAYLEKENAGKPSAEKFLAEKYDLAAGSEGGKAGLDLGDNVYAIFGTEKLQQQIRTESADGRLLRK